MDLSETAAERGFRHTVREWAAANAPGPLPTFEDERAWHRVLHRGGFVGISWPVEYGGRAARPVEQAILAQELGRANVPGYINTPGISHIGPTIMAHGTEAQKRRYLPHILSADELWCQLYSEPNAGSDLAALKTAARRDGEHWVVNGHKIWSSQGPVADFGLLLARTGAGRTKHEGISCFIVDMRAPGMEVRPLRQITGDAEFAEVFLRDVRLAPDSLVGAEGAGWGLAHATLGFERIEMLTSRTARHQANLRRLVALCETLERDGRPLIESDGVRQRLGRMLVEAEVERYACLRVAGRMEKGVPHGEETSIDKLSFTEMERRHGDLIQEILGGFGQLEHGAPDGVDLGAVTFRGHASTFAYTYLRSRSATIGGGTSEIQRTIIGERILKLPREPRADRPARTG